MTRDERPIAVGRIDGDVWLRGRIVGAHVDDGLHDEDARVASMTGATA